MVREIDWSHNIIIMESMSNIQTLEKVQTASAQTREIFGEPNKLAQKSEKEPQKRVELKNNSPQRTQRAQSTGIFKIFFEKTVTLRRRTRITRIIRIFTDPRASVSSVQSVFHPKNPNNHASAFIRVHLRLAESNITPQQRAQSIAAVIFASFALFAVRFINSLNELSSIAQPSAFIGFHPRLTYRTAPAEGR